MTLGCVWCASYMQSVVIETHKDRYVLTPIGPVPVGTTPLTLTPPATLTPIPTEEVFIIRCGPLGFRSQQEVWSTPGARYHIATDEVSVHGPFRLIVGHSMERGNICYTSPPYVSDLCST